MFGTQRTVAFPMTMGIGFRLGTRRESKNSSASALGDFNALLAATVADPGRAPRYYDTEPYLTQDHDDLEYQLAAGTVGGQQLANRRLTEALLHGGYMVDVAAHVGAPWQPTVGHWEDGRGRGDPHPWGSRRIGLILATRPVAPAVKHYGVHVSAASNEASDHRAIFADVDQPTSLSGSHRRTPHESSV
ncbi:hypothetical protein OU787_08735 [Kitasatospora sp. YST-16]|uniref:hypothetical protein n=1 Tax=Kitasatospora sp. YST-16 TaxID=2998080 RepID=UPI00228508E7|nr:hypothetical protein [Kitasatospora sp. YST-16]WAL71583.1 hypothetical protein OU787_08735 [Kitasatospora sp. YST-16]WNW37623.1 hypothetical protein RKE32_08685 [Streptomyces sp. Li-HN-5-13]